jgi:uncharacterized protein (DUF885 family)
MTSPSSATTPAPTRTPTAVDAIAENYLARYAALSPIEATYLGLPGHDEDLDDLSPAGYAAMSALRRETLASLADAVAVDDIDLVTIASMRDRLGVAEEKYAAGMDEMSLNVIASPLQNVRDAFDLMPQDTDEHWRTVATRLAKVPTAMAQYAESLTLARSRGDVAPRRQVDACIVQCRDLTADDSYFTTLVAEAKAGDAALDPEVASDLAAAAEAARAAYVQIADFLETELAPVAPAADACGRERYALHSRDFVGAVVDLEETYRWGQEELARITAQMQEVAEQIKPGPPSKRPSRSSAPTPPTSSKAPTPCAPGCRGRPTRSSRTSLMSTSTSPARCARSSAASRRPRPAASTTRGPRTTSPVPGGCGGRCPRASRGSTRGAS